MAIALTARGSINSATDATSYASGSFTPTANVLLVACYNVERDGADPVQPTLSGHGSWTLVDDLYWNSDISVDRAHQYIFAVDTGSSPGASTVTFSHGATHTGAEASIFELSGTDVANGLVQSFVQFVHSSVNTPTNDLAMTLAAAGHADNRPFFWATSSGGTHDPNTGWTEIHESAHATPDKTTSSQWRSDAFDTSCFVAWSGILRRGAIAFEVKAAVAGGPATRRLQTNVSPRRW